LRRHKVLASAALGGVVLVVIVAVVIGRVRKPGRAAPAPLQVEVVQVQQQDVPIYREWIGTTDGMVNMDIRSQVSGYLLRKAYTEGALVKEGSCYSRSIPARFRQCSIRLKAIWPNLCESGATSHHSSRSSAGPACACKQPTCAGV